MRDVSEVAQDAIVSSLLVPLQQKNLLVPNVAIAEVVPKTNLSPLENAPPWFLGFLPWRGVQVPIVSFEVANSQVHAQDSSQARIAVFNAVSDQSRSRFFGMVVQGIPRMIKLGDNDVREDSQATAAQAEKMIVSTQLGKAVIPDLDYLESLVARVA